MIWQGKPGDFRGTFVAPAGKNKLEEGDKYDKTFSAIAAKMAAW
jgi:hypothetical protein